MIPFALVDQQISFLKGEKWLWRLSFFYRNEAKKIPRQDFVMRNIYRANLRPLPTVPWPIEGVTGKSLHIVVVMMAE